MATNETLIPIPGRLHSVATEGHVAGADEIYDDTLQKDQATINSDVNEALEDMVLIDDSDPSSAVVPDFDPASQSLHIIPQVLSEQQKAQVRANIDLNDLVKYSEQTLTTAQKDQVAANLNNKNATNGMARIELKATDDFKAVVEAQTGGNTIFVIKYDFALTGNVNIPANCILEFDGGSISGAYTITGQNTGIQAELVKILDTNVTLAGSWKIAESYPEWFGAKGDGTTDDTIAIQKTIDSFDVVKLVSNNSYVIYPDNENVCLRLSKGKTLKGVYRKATAAEHKAILLAHGSTVIGILGTTLNTIEDISIKGVDTTGFDNTRVYNSIGIKIKGRNNLIQRVDVMTFHIGFEFDCFETNITNCLAMTTKTGFYCHGNTNNKWYENAAQVNYNNTSLTLMNCYVMSATTEGYVFQGITCFNVISCAADGCGLPFEDVAITSQDAIFYPYAFYRCTSFTVLGCGAEVCGRFMRYYRCAGCSVENCNCALDFRISSVDNIKPHSIILLNYDSGIMLKYIIIQKGSNIQINSGEICITSDSLTTIMFAPGMGDTLGTQLFTDRTCVSNWGTSANYTSVIPTVKMKGALADIPDPYTVGIGNVYIESDNNKPVFNLGNKWVYADGSDIQ